MTGASRQFRADHREVGATRHFARCVLDDWRLDSDDTVLVVSELAADALRHTVSGFAVSLAHSEHTVLVEVTDFGDGTPSLTEPADTATAGRGLLIVDGLARSWGSRPAPRGAKTVRAEVPTQ